MKAIELKIELRKSNVRRTALIGIMQAARIA